MRFYLLAVCLALPVSAQQCSLSIVPNSASFAASGGTGLITITAQSCAWAVSSSADWITISFGQVGTGNGTAGYTVQANPSPSQRVGTIHVAGQTFTVTQAGASCTYELNPSSATVPASGGSGSFAVASSCSWNATTTASWVRLTVGTGSVSWVASANTTTTQRTANISIGNASFTITQPGQCVFTLTTTQVSFTGQGGSGTITIRASNGACERPASSTVPWITLLSGQTGTGDGTIQFTVDRNPTASPRNGAIQVGQQSVSIGQFGSTCTFALSPQRATVAANGGTGAFSVTTTCDWAPTTNANWIQITSATASTTGAGTVTYLVSSNPEAQPRTAGITVGNAIFYITQPGVACEVSLSRETMVFGAEGGTGTVEISLLSTCSWTAASTVDWIVLDNPRAGSGDGLLSFRVQPNTASRSRTGDVTIGNRIFRVTQAAAPCSTSLSVRTITIPAGGGTGVIEVTSNCDWSATTGAGWIRFQNPSSGTGNGSVSFTAAANTSTEARSATIVVSGQSVSVTQPAPGCGGLTLSSLTASLPPRGGTTMIEVTGSAACDWSASGGDSWAQITWASVSGSGRITVTAPPNTSGETRTSTVNVANQSIRVTQPPVTLRISAEGVVNAASGIGGAVAPGEMVAIYGTGFGPNATVGYQLSTDRAFFTKQLSDTRVLFDGIAAPIVFSSDGVVSAVVPYGVADKPQTQLQVEYLGVRSNTATMPVRPTAMGIFTADASGRGQAAASNQDYSVNGPTAPAERGSYVFLYATGEGVTDPAGADGKLTATPLPRPLAPIRVRIGGIDSEVQYAGGAPGLVAGVVQINVRIPPEIAPGPAVPVVILAGEQASPAGVTIAVR